MSVAGRPRPSAPPAGNSCLRFFFFFNDTATTEIYTLSLHDALPICGVDRLLGSVLDLRFKLVAEVLDHGDRKSTRLNSSHANISYAVFCLKKKKTITIACMTLLTMSPKTPLFTAPTLLFFIARPTLC